MVVDTVKVSEADKLLDDICGMPVELVYLDPPFCSQRDFGEFDDREPLDAYLSGLGAVLGACKRLMESPRSGVATNIVIHCDWHASHYVKCLADSHFGIQNFMNEVVWAYNSGGASKKHLSRKHDVLLWWSAKPSDPIFTVLREPYATPNVKGREGFHDDGRMLTDVWNIPFLSTTSKERCGYPTQKPLALLERVVTLWSKPGGLVVDPMCGSGTTGVAAARLGRTYILGDMNETAVETATRRLTDVNSG